jgi:hypothetical protein
MSMTLRRTTYSLLLPLALIAPCALLACSSTSTSGSGGTDPGDGGSSSSSSTSSSGGSSSGSSGTSGDAGGSSGGATSITGTLGKLGAAQPTVSSLFISNSGETLVYMSTAPITCQLLSNSRWLGSVAANSQVVEVVIKGNPVVGNAVAVPPGEVNYAAGGKSSSYEVNAAGGSITFTAFTAKSVVEGNFSASYDDGSSIKGSFHADFCDGGQGY